MASTTTIQVNTTDFEAVGPNRSARRGMKRAESRRLRTEGKKEMKRSGSNYNPKKSHKISPMAPISKNNNKSKKEAMVPAAIIVTDTTTTGSTTGDAALVPEIKISAVEDETKAASTFTTSTKGNSNNENKITSTEQDETVIFSPDTIEEVTVANEEVTPVDDKSNAAAALTINENAADIVIPAADKLLTNNVNDENPFASESDKQTNNKIATSLTGNTEKSDLLANKDLTNCSATSESQEQQQQDKHIDATKETGVVKKEKEEGEKQLAKKEEEKNTKPDVSNTEPKIVNTASPNKENAISPNNVITALDPLKLNAATAADDNKPVSSASTTSSSTTVTSNNKTKKISAFKKLFTNTKKIEASGIKESSMINEEVDNKKKKTKAWKLWKKL